MNNFYIFLLLLLIGVCFSLYIGWCCGKDYYKCDYKCNKLHREDGPAVIYFDGIKYWYINGKEYSFEEC